MQRRGSQIELERALIKWRIFVSAVSTYALVVGVVIVLFFLAYTLLWEAVRIISVGLAEGCADYCVMVLIGRFTSSQRSTSLPKAGLSNALKLLEPIKEKYSEPSDAHLFQLIFAVAI